MIVNEEDGVVIIDGNSTSGNNIERRSKILFEICKCRNDLLDLVSVAPNKPGSLSGSTGKSKLMRRSSVKLRKPSLRIKDSSKGKRRTKSSLISYRELNLVTRRSSYRTRRRSHVSNISSETDGHQSNIGSSAMEPTDEYFNGNDDDFDQGNFDDIINTRPFPWIKVVIRIMNNVNLTCDHQIKCLSNCYDKQTRSCKNLIQALLNMYRLSTTNLTNIDSSFSRSSSSTHRSTTHLKRNDTTSSKSQHDLKKRRVRLNESTRERQISIRMFLAFDLFIRRCGAKCRQKCVDETTRRTNLWNGF